MTDISPESYHQFAANKHIFDIAVAKALEENAKLILNDCRCGSDKLEHFVNESYYHMYTIRCYGCEKEWDFPTKEIAFKKWNTGDIDGNNLPLPQ